MLDPLDFQNFLLINPPLVEYSEYLDEKLPLQLHTPQRRLSISNGQIAQMAQRVHELHPQPAGPPPAAVLGEPFAFAAPVDDSSLDLALAQPQQQLLQPGSGSGLVTGSGSHALTQSHSAPSSGPTQQLSPDMRKQRILERNRIAASKCRQKKKHEQKRLAEELDDLRFHRDLNRKMKPLLLTKVAQWVKMKDPQLADLSEDQIAKLVLMDGTANDQTVQTWLQR